MDANQRDQKQGARTATCLFHPNARQRNDGKSIWSEGKGRRTYARAHPRADACTLRSTCFWKSNVAFMLFGFILSWGFYQHPLRHSFCSFLPTNKVGGRLLTRINNSRIFFLLQLVMKGSLCSHSRSSSPPRVPTERAERAHHVLFVVPVTPQMSQGKTASIPTRLFPPDFWNSRAGSRGSSSGEPGESAASLPSW